MRSASFFLLLGIIFFCSSSRNTFAQEEENHIFLVQKFEFKLGDGSIAEFDSLNQLYTDRVINKIDKMLSVRMLRHAWGSDSRDLIIISEYKNMADMLESYEMIDELFIEAWAIESERMAYDDASTKYLGHHSDEIYHEVVSGRK